MNHYTKKYWFKRLPSLRLDAEAWISHMEQHWNFEAFLPQEFISSEEVRKRLHHFMPELLTEFDPLLSAFPERPGWAQRLAMYNLNLPAFFSGCSVSISNSKGHPTLIRNYDLGVDDFSGVFRYEPLPDGGWIIGSDEGGWGYLDGLNHHGLAVAITFGGSFKMGNGFGIPIVVRYLLTTSRTVQEALERLRQIPHPLTQNIILLDRQGHYSVAYVSPESVTVDEGLICSTNHQRQVREKEHAMFTRTVERFDELLKKMGTVSAQDFLEEPLYSRKFLEHFGTLYTVEIDPISETAHYFWPQQIELLVMNESPETELEVHLIQS